MERRPVGMGNSWRLVCCGVLLAAGIGRAAEPQDDATLARQLYERADFLDAMPVYERLAAAQPENAVYAERLAFCLTANLQMLPAGQQREDMIVRARAEAERARKLGSNSGLLPSVTTALNSSAIHAPSSEEDELRDAEMAFGKGDLDAALAGYKAAAARHPTSYLAHLDAGDVYYRKGDIAGAAEWFGKAIAINPDIETAYRYWGDTLARSGDDKAALAYYIRAVVAEPYKQASRGGLQAWVKRNGATLQSPQLPRPKVGLKDDGTGKGPAPVINLDQNAMADPRAGAAWVAYAANRVLWLKGRYLERHPGETEYRHSLDEEVESLRLAVQVIQKDLPDAAQLPALRDLVRLSKDDMLEPYVLLNGVDAGIAQDYPAYRATHREQLAAFIEKYLIVRPPAGQ